MMRQLLWGWSLVAATLGSGCVSSQGVESQGMLRALVEKAPSKKKQFAPSFRFDLMPIKQGQFAQYLVTLPKGGYQGVRFEVLGEGEMPFSRWFEVEFLTEEKRTVVRVLSLLDDARLAVAQRGERFEPVLQDFTRVVRARSWSLGDSNSHLEEPDMLARAVPGWGEIFLLKSLKISGRDTVVSRAGNFRCHKAVAEANFLEAKGIWKVCVDNQIPLNGVVDATDALGRYWELVSYGAGGSKVSLPDVFP